MGRAVTLEEDFLFIPAEDIPAALDVGMAGSGVVAAADRAPARSSSMPVRGRGGRDAKLAAAVEEIRAAEDDMTAGARTADEWLRKLVAMNAHLESGYSSLADFEQRLLSFTPFLKAIRDSLPQGRAPARKGRSVGRAKSDGDARSRRTRAFTSIAESLEELRFLERDMRMAGARAHGALQGIESKRLFEECGYASYEEFLERALWKSPVLATAIAMADRDLPEVPLPDEMPLGASDAGEETDVPPALSGAFAAGSPAPAAEGEPAPGAASLPVPAPKARGGAPMQLLLTAALCLLGTFGGAAAGSWGSGAPAAPADETHESPKEGKAAHVATDIAPAKGHDAKTGAPRKARDEAHDGHEGTLPTSSAPHAHPGPREARR
jgi:hypothetical protein